MDQYGGVSGSLTAMRRIGAEGFRGILFPNQVSLFRNRIQEMWMKRIKTVIVLAIVLCLTVCFAIQEERTP